MTKLTENKGKDESEGKELSPEGPVSYSLVFRGVPESKRIELEKLAEEFTIKKRKLVNYIEK
ncbi:hypothetical protein ACLKMH_16320 [Psychromonas sp. KJ10-10]|uniref:hypothetical protein n=1 Tax=Psychromonas sp. KJ10-10 TaxID=3391823 RepID=UPI0039B47FC0